MNLPLAGRLAKITTLVRAGKLDGAVAAIQKALSGKVEGPEPSEAETTIDMVPPDTQGGVWKAVNGDTGEAASVKAAPAGRTQDANSAKPSSFTVHSFANSAGARDYKLYVPKSYSGKAMPLIVMMHGCTQSPDDFAAGTRMNALADQFGFLVAYPEQSRTANPQKCWNWFNASDQQRDKGEPSLIVGITRKIMTEFNIDPNKVFVAGLSAGGAAAAVLGQTYPDVYAAVGIHSGLASGAARDMMSAFGVMKNGAAKPARVPDQVATVRAIVFHGDADQTVHPLNGDHAVAQFSGGKTRKTRLTDSQAGASYTKTSYSDAAGRIMLEHWLVHAGGHVWFGGSQKGSYTSPKGPDASSEMVRFFLDL